MSSEGYLSIPEAAQALGVSEKTVRRRIQRGDLPAEKMAGPYGLQYQIPAHAISTAQEIMDVVKVERPTDPRTLGLVVAEAIKRENQALRDELAALRLELDQTRKEFAAALESDRQRLEERDRRLLEAIREKQQDEQKKKRAWWPWRR